MNKWKRTETGAISLERDWFRSHVFSLCVTRSVYGSTSAASQSSLYVAMDLLHKVVNSSTDIPSRAASVDQNRVTNSSAPGTPVLSWKRTIDLSMPQAPAIFAMDNTWRCDRLSCANAGTDSTSAKVTETIVLRVICIMFAPNQLDQLTACTRDSIKHNDTTIAAMWLSGLSEALK